MPGFLSALVGTRGLDESFALAAVLDFAINLRALTGAPTLAGVRAHALHRSGRGSGRRRCSTLLRHRRGREKKRGDRRG